MNLFQNTRWLLALKICSIVTVVAVCIAGWVAYNTYYRTLTFVPFVKYGSQHATFDPTNCVTFPKHRKVLSKALPKVGVITDLNALTPNKIIVLPWNVNTKGLRHVDINGVAFYQSPKGTLQLNAFKKEDDGYTDFLNQSVTLTAGGTVVLARGVHRVIQRQNNVDYPWLGTRAIFKQSDINVVNFKSPLIDDFEYPKSSWKLYGKSIYAKSLKNANIHVVSVSGNHMGDAGKTGLLDTIRTLKEHGIESVGAGATHNEAYTCKVMGVKNIQFGFLAFNNVPGSIGKAEKSKTGIAWLDNDALNAISRCKAVSDLVVLMVNWGTEYVHKPREKEVAWAKKLVDYGADIILGDQAHWVQQHQTINQAHVSYGLGNYIFDQHWSEKTKEGILQTFVVYNKKLQYVHTIPVKLNRKGGVDIVPKGSSTFHQILSVYETEVNKK
jgi:hypothetical protein